MRTIKTYGEMLTHNTYGDRLAYLSLYDNNVDSPRSINHMLYKSKVWKHLRDEIIIRDNGCDLGILNVPIHGKILVHHINPVTEEDILEWNEDKLFSPSNLVCVSQITHNHIHYGVHCGEEYVERKEGDTKLW